MPLLVAGERGVDRNGRAGLVGLEERFERGDDAVQTEARVVADAASVTIPPLPPTTSGRSTVDRTVQVARSITTPVAFRSPLRNTVWSSTAAPPTSTGRLIVDSRNLTRDEWTTHVGDLAPYRQTCPG